jgi:hypothetical protein
VDAVKEAQALYNESLDALSDQRKQIEEDLRFSDPSDPQQWDDEVKTKREGDPGGKRPCLVFDQCGQYVANVAGQVEQRPPALHAIPVGNGADKKVAESLDGFFRHVEHTSRAQQHYAIGLTSAARAGVGYLIVRPEFTDRALGFQEPRISSQGDPLRIVFDPWSVELDGSDATFGFEITPFSHREFDRQWKGKDKISFGEDEQSKDERESINVVTQWKIVDKTQNMVFCIDLTKPDQDVFALPEEDFLERFKKQEVKPAQDSAGRTEYKDKYRCVKWSRMSGSEILTEEREYPATSIGIVPIYGYVGWANGRMTYCGIPRRARAPQQSYNYHMSEIHAYMGTAPKSPWMVPLESLIDENVKAMWDKASTEARAYIPYRSLTEDGKQIPPPSRTPITINLTNHMQGAVQAKEDIQASIGMYQANLGAPSNETSGIAIENRKEQGEASTAHFPSHLAASLGQVGKIVMEMIPRLIDTKRQVRVLSIDQTPSTVVVDPDMSGAIQEPTQGTPLSINPNVGKYDVRVVVGASFSTQRQQAQQAYTEMMRASPEMMPIIGPLWAQTLDVPHADKLAQVLTAAAPPEVKAVLQPNQEDNTANLKAENEQLKAALAEAVQVAEEAQSEFTQAKAEAEEANANAKAKLAGIELDRDKLRLEFAKARDHHDLEERKISLQADTMEKDDERFAVEQKTRQEDLERSEAEKASSQDIEQDDAMEEALTTAVETVVKGQDQVNKSMQQLAQGQEQNAQLMQQLIKLIQAPRKREPKYDKHGELIGSVETIDLPPTIQ